MELYSEPAQGTTMKLYLPRLLKTSEVKVLCSTGYARNAIVHGGCWIQARSCC